MNQRAESAIVRPDPPNGEAIREVILDDLAQTAKLVLTKGASPASIFESGFMGGLALAIDRPDLAIPVLAALDQHLRDSLDVKTADAEVLNRASTIQEIADAADGKRLASDSFSWGGPSNGWVH